MTYRFGAAALLGLALCACTTSFQPADGSTPDPEPDPRPRDAGPDAFDWEPFDGGTRTEALRFENEGSLVIARARDETEIHFDTNSLPREVVDFEVSELPFRSNHYGYGILLYPEEGDQGEYELDVIARIGDEVATATYRITVIGEDDPRPPGGVNVGPMWLPQPDLLELYPPATWGGTSEWPIIATATVDATVCDEEGHVITLEIEVVPAGETPRERPTHQQTQTPEPYFGTRDLCAQFRIPLTGLADGRYGFWAHAVDELGADDPYGWVHFRNFELRAE